MASETPRRMCRSCKWPARDGKKLASHARINSQRTCGSKHQAKKRVTA